VGRQLVQVRELFVGDEMLVAVELGGHGAWVEHVLDDGLGLLIVFFGHGELLRGWWVDREYRCLARILR
jgi:hypothetical protein